jgi:hypothetical protein
MRLRYRIVGLVAALALLGSACTSDPPEEEDERGSQEAAMLAHAQCMRDHGFDWPDPVFLDGEWETHYEGIDLDSPEFQEAEVECERVRMEALPDTGTMDDPGERAQIEAELETMLEFAACMRDQGVDFPDPQLDDSGVISGPAGPADGDWETFEAAREFCEVELNEPMP